MTDAAKTVFPLFRGPLILWRGFRLWTSSPGMFWLGLLPAVLTSVIFVGLLTMLAFWSPQFAEWITPFAESWAAVWAQAIRITLSIALVGAAAVALAFCFVAVTTAIGGPIYERIAAAVEKQLDLHYATADTSPAIPTTAENESAEPKNPEATTAEATQAKPPAVSTGRSIRDGLALFAQSIAISLGMFLLGLIPAIGSVAGTVIGALSGGWLLALELTALPFEQRGHPLPARRKALKKVRLSALGFGVCVFLLFLIPLGAIIVMPAAVAGGVVLAREALEKTQTL